MGIFKPKLFSILKKGYSKDQFIADLIAGIIVGIVALPLAIAFAVASGVSPEKGMITAVVAGFIVSMLGGSRVQIAGPTGAFIVIVFGIVTQYGFDGLLISTILAGVILIIFGVLRLGALLKFFPHPLIVGFTSGIAVVIFSTQVKDALGFSAAGVPSEFIEKWQYYLTNLTSIDPFTFAITIITILIVVYFPKITTKVPGSFIAIFLLTGLVYFLDIPVKTIESYFGDISFSFAFTFPDFANIDLTKYLTPALTIAFLGAIESLLSAVVADGMISGNHRSNTELIAQGIANIITPFFGGIPATGAIARTATNVKNGGRTPVAGMVHSLVLLLIVIFFAGLAKLIPMSVLAGILIVVSYNMSEWRSFVSILKGSWFDIIVLLSTFLLTVLIDLTVAIEVGIVLSALLFMKRMSDINADKFIGEFDKDVIDDYSALDDRISIYEISGPFFFGSAKNYSQLIKSLGLKSSIIIIRMRHVPFIDSTGLHNFKDTLNILTESKVTVFLSGVNENVKRELCKSKIDEIIGSNNIYDDFNDALEKANIHLVNK